MGSISASASQPSGAFPPPPGVTPNLISPTDHRHTINIAGLAICNAFVVCFFTLRCIARWRLSLVKTAEDWACQAAFGFCVFYITTCFMMARYGEGYHAWEVTPENYKQILKWLYASSIIWIPATFFVKATLLLLIARVFAVYQRAAKCIKIYVLFILVAYLPIQGIKIFICTPIRHYWDSAIPGRCLDQPKVFLADTALAIITDFMILAIPIPLTWKLRMPMRRKLKIVAMLGAGGCAVAVACYREYKIYKFQWSTDVSGDFVVLNLCGTIELTIGMVCACLPPINLFIEKFVKPIISRNYSRTPFWPARSSWRIVERSKRVTGSPCFSTTVDNMTSTVDGDASISRVNDVEHGPTTTVSDRPNMEPIAEPEALHHMDLQNLLRHNSADGRREGWLTTDNSEVSNFIQEESKNQSKPRAQITLEQLRQDARELIIPDRIWDGTQRILGTERCSSSMK